MNNTRVRQTFLLDAYEYWNEDFVEIVCESCAVEIADAYGLEWRGGKPQDSFTEHSEKLGVGVSCIPTWALGESDTPYSCCGWYLKTSLTSDGVEYLRENFPKWVQELYWID